MILKSIYPILFSLLALPSMAQAERVLVTPEGLPSLVRQGNPSLAAARLTIDEAAGRLLGAGRLSNPELEFGGEHNHRFKEGGVEIGFSQQFPLTDRLRHERDVSTVELEAARAEVRNTERLLVADARVSLVRLLMLGQQEVILEKRMKVASDLADYIGKAAERGEGSVLDAGQARLDAVSHAATLRQIKAMEAAELGALKRLIGLGVDAQVSVGGTLPTPRLPDGGVAVEGRPDRMAAELAVEQSDAELALEQSKRYEDLKVGLVAGVERSEDAPEGLENEGIIGVRLSMPLPWWNQNEGGIAEAEARAERRKIELVAKDQLIRNEVESARAEMEQWLAMANSIDSELLPLAEKQASQAEDAYRNGQGNLQAVLAVREQELELAASRLEALREFHLARVRYEAAVGE